MTFWAGVAICVLALVVPLVGLHLLFRSSRRRHH